MNRRLTVNHRAVSLSLELLAFSYQLKREWGRLRRIYAPLSLIMCDIDYFKPYNDFYAQGFHLSRPQALIDAIYAYS